MANGPGQERVHDGVATSHAVEQQLAELRLANDRLNSELNARDEEIERLRSAVRERDARIDALTSHMSKVRRGLAHYFVPFFFPPHLLRVDCGASEHVINFLFFFLFCAEGRVP